MVATFLILYLIFLKIEFKVFYSVFFKTSLSLVLVAFFICSAHFFISTVKWRRLASFLGAKLKLIYYLKLNLIGLFYTAIMPGGAVTGDLIKCYRVFKTSQDRRVLVSAIFMDRLTGFVGLLLSIVLGSFVPGSEGFPYYHELAIISVALLALFFCSLLFMGEIEVCLKKIAARIYSPAEDILDKVFFALRSYSKNYFLLAWAVAVGAIMYVISSVAIYALAAAASIDVSFFDVFVVNCLSNLALILAPVTFFGFGIREGSFVYFLGSVGIARESALFLSLAFGVLSLTIGMIGGIIEGSDLILLARTKLKATEQKI
ncbi:MAG: lysylphosphatidylglycerol synthase transmembrane domain-containing protein [Candidatus Portnoybacteria bacterium]|nr:lysylphosphatidylglycerol synthase transmembrane domain-containing protein [Candidatus Portnoybacteria bacterium]MDD4982479.1 lysylphosphatidylglycerol synthase transmembrane domain-containing protein [Candidatus Portnoybacteria bacterium]